MSTKATNSANIVAEAAQRMREKFEKDKIEDRAAAIREYEAEYEEIQARKKRDFVRSRMRDDYVPPSDPYERMSDQDLFRLSLDPDERIPALIEAGCTEQALQCFVFRSGGEVTVDELKAWLKNNTDVPTEGTGTIRSRSPHNSMEYLVHAENLSKELYNLIRSCGFEVRHGVVRWIVGYEDVERDPKLPTLAPGSPTQMREVLASEAYDPKKW